MNRTIVALLAAGTVAVAAPAAAQTTIDFEGQAGGSVGATYSMQGITFSGAFFHQCGGGCPTPAFGTFISSNDFTSPFTATFSGTAGNFSFANVSNSSGTATAFNAGGTTLETINFADFPGTFTFASNNIASVTFSTGGAFGVDDFSYTLNAASGVPEPASWALMIMGFGAVCFAMRRRSTVRTAVRFA